jgi:hypothetical protein
MMRRQFTGALIATAALLLPATAVAEPAPLTQPPTTTTTTTPACLPNCGGRIVTDPSRAVPGTTIAIITWCGGNGHDPAPVSAALTGIKRVRPYRWNATVRDVAPGAYPVTLSCPDTATTSVVVLAPPARQKKPQVPVKPKGAPQTGGGGTA